jgi:hypothetical protein
MPTCIETKNQYKSPISHIKLTIFGFSTLSKYFVLCYILLIHNCQRAKWHIIKPETTGTKPPEQESEQPKPKSNNTRTIRNSTSDQSSPLILLSTCYHIMWISRAILRIYVILMASMEDMKKLNETKLFSFQICMKTVQIV